MLLPIGNVAPDFELNCTPDQTLKLSALRGRKVILAFYPADWSLICSDQIALINETLTFFNKQHASVIGISVDSKWSHLAFTQDRKIHFPLLADFEPKGAVSKMYGVYDEQLGESLRALFIIGEEGIIRWNYLSPTGINGILDALETIK